MPTTPSRSLALVALVSTLVLTAHVSAQASGSPSAPTTGVTIPIERTIASGLVLGAGLTLYFAGTGQPWLQPRWRGGILADDAMRDAMRIGSPEGRALAASLSDGLLALVMAAPLVIDAWATPLLQNDPQLAVDASLAYSLAMGITLVLGDLVKTAVGRARPYERLCAGDPAAPGCGTADSYASFYSLHTAMAFTSAGFTCAMHLERTLFDDPAADLSMCGASIVAATAVGALRIASDRHYLSDVVVGALMGFVVGYLVPTLLVPPRHRRASDLVEAGMESRTSTFVMPMLGLGGGGQTGGTTIGASISGTF